MRNTANTAITGLEIPAMYFRFHDFSTFAGTPMDIRIMFYSCKCMNMGIGGSQFKAAMDTKLIFPILCVFACYV